MKILKHTLLCLCSLLCVSASGVGIAKVSNQVNAFAATVGVTSDAWTISNLSGGEYWIHNDKPITNGKDFTIEFTTGKITHGEAAHGVWGPTRSENKDGWAYNTVVANGNYFTLMQNGTANVSLDDSTHYRFYFKYITSGANAGKYEFNAYRNGTHYYNNQFRDYMPYMGLYFYGFKFETPLTGIKCYEGSGADATDLGAYAEQSKSVGFYMEDGASIRLSDPTGLGFTSRISLSDYNEAVATYGAENVSTGTLIAMTSDVATLGAFTHADLDAQGVKYLDVENEGFKNEATATEDGYYAWRGSIVNMYAHNLTKDFSAVGYYCVNGEYTYTAYNAEDNSRNVRYVAKSAYNDTSDTKTDNFSNAITDGAHPDMGKYSPYTLEQLQILSQYIVTMEDTNFWWSIESQQATSYGVTLTATGATSWTADFVPVGDNAMPDNMWTTLTLNASTVNMLMAEGISSVTLKFDSKANQGAYFALYPYGNNSVALKNGNLSCSYIVELTEEAAKDGISFTVVTADIHTAWNKPDDMDGFTLSMDLNTTYDEDKPLTWFTYDGKSNGISYNEENESWQFDVENYKTLTLRPEVIAQQMAKGVFAVRFDVSGKPGQSTAFDFGGGKGGNNSFSFTVDLTEDLCTNGWSAQTYFRALEGEVDGYVLSLEWYTLDEFNEDNKATWFTYNGASNGISYNEENESWQFDVENYKILKLAPEALAKYRAEGAAALQFTVSSKANQATSFDFRGGGYGMANGSISFTVDLTDELCENGWSVQPYFATWSTAAPAEETDGFMLKITTVGAYDIPAKWFTYNGTTSGISYENDVWTVAGESSQTLTLDKDVVDAYLDQGIATVKVAIGTKDGKAIQSSMQLPYSTDVVLAYSGSYNAENNSVMSNGGISMTIKLTEEMARDGLSMSIVYRDRGWAGDVVGADGFTVTLTTVQVEQTVQYVSPKDWVIGQGMDVAYDWETGKYTLTSATEDVLPNGNTYIGISTWMIDKLVAEGKTTLQIQFHASSFPTYTLFYVPSYSAVNIGSGTTKTIDLKIQNLSANGDASSNYSVDGYFTIHGYFSLSSGLKYIEMTFLDTPAVNPAAEDWVIGKGMDVAYDDATGQYTLTATGQDVIPNGTTYIAISTWMIDKLVAEGKTTLSLTFEVETFPTYILCYVPSYSAVNIGSGTTKTIDLNIKDLSANGDASSEYSADGYYTLKFYFSDNGKVTLPYIKMTFSETPAEPYKIVYAARAENTEYEAAMMLAERIKEATGITCEVISDRHITWTETANYISVGQTALLEDAGLGALAEQNVTDDGYIRRKVGNTLFIDGITARGTLYGVLDYLADAYNYVFIDDDTYTYTADDELKINVGEKDFSPTFNTRTYLTYGTYNYNTDAEYALYNKANCYYVYEPTMKNYGGVNKIGAVGQVDHNMWDALAKGVELYNAMYGTSYVATDFAREYTVNSATNYNPCLSGGLSVNGLTAWDFITLAMKDCILSQYQDGVVYYSLTEEDDSAEAHYCVCTLCVQQANLYGRSGLLVNFVNRMIEALDADADFKAKKITDYRLITYAYNYSLEVPKGGVTCNDKLVIRLAYGPDSAQKGISANVNNYIAQWSEIANELMYWGYSADFRAYIPYYPTLTAMADDVKFLKDHKVTFVMMLGAYNADNIWHNEMRAYVYSRLMYDFDEAAYAADKNTYVQSIVAEYLNVYYGEYADEVQSVINYYQNEYAAKTPASGKEYATCLTRDQHTSAYNLIKSSYENCTDAVMKKRLASVAASCYTGILLASDWGRGQYIATAKALCEAAGITQWSEMVTVATFLAS